MKKICFILSACQNEFKFGKIIFSLPMSRSRWEGGGGGGGGVGMGGGGEEWGGRSETCGGE